MVRAFEVDVEHGIPLVFFHPHQQVVPRDARIVDEDVDFAPRVEHGFDQCIHRFGIGHVGLSRDGLAALGANFLGHGLGGFRALAGAQGDIGPFACKAQSNGLANAARPASYEGRFVDESVHGGQWLVKQIKSEKRVRSKR